MFPFRIKMKVWAEKLERETTVSFEYNIFFCIRKKKFPIFFDVSHSEKFFFLLSTIQKFGGGKIIVFEDFSHGD